MDQDLNKTETMPQPFESLAKENKLLKDQLAAAVGETKVVRGSYEILEKKHFDLQAQYEISKLAASERVVVPEKGLPKIGSKVTFVNHAGKPEVATIIGHGNKTVHISVQGRHINDKYTREDVPMGGPGERLTVFES